MEQNSRGIAQVAQSHPKPSATTATKQSTQTSESSANRAVGLASLAVEAERKGIF